MSDQNLIQTIENNGYTTLQSYNSGNEYLSHIYPNIVKSNDDSIIGVVNSGNAQLAQLNNINVGLLSDLNQEILVKKDELIKIQNDNLTKQLRNLEVIESTIENKNAIIDQINYNMNTQQRNIKVLIVSFIFGIILLSNIISYGYYYINYSTFIYVILIIIISYTSFILYQYNIFYVQSAINAIFNRNTVQRLVTSVDDLGNYLEESLEDDLYGDKSGWIQQNCNCKEAPAEEYEPPINGTSKDFTELSGYYYYDASAPPQLIQPTPTANTLEYIDWVDYDNTESNSRTYYNGNSTSLSNEITNQLNSPLTNTLSGNYTWTSNL